MLATQTGTSLHCTDSQSQVPITRPIARLRGTWHARVYIVPTDVQLRVGVLSNRGATTRPKRVEGQPLYSSHLGPQLPPLPLHWRGWTFEALL